MPIDTKQARLAIDSPLVMGVMLLMWALLAGLAFPNVGWWPTAHLCLVPLTLVALRASSLRRVLLLSYIAGYVWWMVMLWWLTQVTLPGKLVLDAYLALYLPVYVWIIRTAARCMHAPMVFAVPVVWVALEYIRGWMITGFPWFSLGHSQPTSMIQIADFAGTYGVSFVVALTSGMICDLLTNPLVITIGGRRKMGSAITVALVVWIMVTGCTLIYGALRLAEYEDLTAKAQPSDVLAVGIVQTDVPQDNKNAPSPEQAQAWFDDAIRLTADIAPKVDLVVWPETIVPRALNDDAVQIYRRLGLADYAAYRTTLERTAGEFGIGLIVGASAALDFKPYEQGGETFFRQTTRYNSAYFIDPSGNLRGRYDKMHRVLFGEYIPFAEWPWVQNLLINLTPYDYNYSLTAGSGIVVFELPVEGRVCEASPEPRTWRVATPICFEDVISYVCRNMVYDDGRKRADVLANLTNDGWYPGTTQGWQHEQIARFRCVENRVPMVRSVNRGVSSVIDSCGRIIERVQVNGRNQMVAGSATASVFADPRSTLFGKLGDVVGFTCMVITLVVVLIAMAMARLERKQA